MIINNIKSIFVLSLVCASVLMAEADSISSVTQGDNNKSSTDKATDPSYNYSKGWNLYVDPKITKTQEEELKKEPIAKKIELDILQKILDESRKQTKIQEKILSLLEEEMDPKPKEVTIDGKKCIANSSADCFMYPMIAEAKRVPAMAEFLKDPYDLTKAGEYLKWQSKLFTHAINIGNSMQFAYAQWGEKAYPIGARTPSYTSAGGSYESKILPAAEKELIISHKKDLSFSVFVGKNITMDIYSALTIADVIREYGEMNIEIIYYDQKSKDVFEGAVTSVYNIDKIAHWKTTKKTINPKAFDELQIFTTPSFVAKYKSKDKNEAQTILNGKIDLTSFRNRVISFMELKKIIDYKEFSESKAWKNDTAKEVVKDFYKSTQNTDVGGLLK